MLSSGLSLPFVCGSVRSWSMLSCGSPPTFLPARRYCWSFSDKHDQLFAAAAALSNEKKKTTRRARTRRRNSRRLICQSSVLFVLYPCPSSLCVSYPPTRAPAAAAALFALPHRTTGSPTDYSITLNFLFLLLD